MVQRAPSGPVDLPAISVVPGAEAVEPLTRCMTTLRGSDRPDLEVVVAADGAGGPILSAVPIVASGR